MSQQPEATSIIDDLNQLAHLLGLRYAGPVPEIKAPPKIDVRIRRLSDETRKELGLE